MKPAPYPRIPRLVAASALASLAFAGYFLVTRPASATPALDSVAIANKAVRDQLLNAGPAPRTAVADVVAKALAFKALLTAAQQATLEQTYTVAWPGAGRICLVRPIAAMASNSVRSRPSNLPPPLK